MATKDELLSKIVALEQGIEEAKKTKEDELAQAKALETQKAAVKKAYDMMKERFDAATRALEDKKSALVDINRKVRNDDIELSRARRELSRLADAEAINARYQAEVDAFRARCLDAPWRPENRSDGIGAKDYQVDGAIHMAVAKRGILADRMGLGKSLTSLIWCDFNESQKVVIVAPSDTLNNYVREIHLWAPHRHPIVLGGMPPGQRDFLLQQMKTFPDYMLILNFEAWRKDPMLLDDINALKPDTLIVDEAHNIKEWTTDACKGVQKLTFGLNQCPSCVTPVLSVGQSDSNEVTCKHCGHVGFITEFCSVKNVLPMTGTPILNKPQEIFPLLRMIDPKNFKTQNEFLRDFCRKDFESGHWTWQFGKEEQLVKKIGPRFLARDRKMVGVAIPPPAHLLHLISMLELEENYPKQFRAYKQVRDYAQLVMDDAGENVMSMPVFLTIIMRMRQVAVWPAGIELRRPDEVTGDKVVVANLDVFESAKVDKAEQLIREAVEGGERVVIFSQFKDSLRELHRRFRNSPVSAPIRSAIYAGETSAYHKRQIEIDFDSKSQRVDGPIFDVVLANYRSGGAGLNFQAASQMVILDEEWNPGKQNQAFGRIDRLGQTRDTTIHTIRIENSVDTWMAALQEEKSELVGGFEKQSNIAQKFFDDLRNGDI